MLESGLAAYGPLCSENAANYRVTRRSQKARELLRGVRPCALLLLLEQELPLVLEAQVYCVDCDLHDVHDVERYHVADQHSEQRWRDDHLRAVAALDAQVADEAADDAHDDLAQEQEELRQPLDADRCDEVADDELERNARRFAVALARNRRNDLHVAVDPLDELLQAAQAAAREPDRGFHGLVVAHLVRLLHALEEVLEEPADEDDERRDERRAEDRAEGLEQADYRLRQRVAHPLLLVVREVPLHQDLRDQVLHAAVHNEEAPDHDEDDENENAQRRAVRGRRDQPVVVLVRLEVKLIQARVVLAVAVEQVRRSKAPRAVQCREHDKGQRQQENEPHLVDRLHRR